MLPVAKACLQYDPDFLVVYLGNNEVVGPYGAGSLYLGASNNLMFLRLSDSIKSLRLYQMILMVTGGHQVASGSWKGMEYFVENALFEDDERLQTVYRHFDRNLSDMISAAADKDCPVILSTVGVNLLDCPPFVSKKPSTPMRVTKRDWLIWQLEKPKRPWQLSKKPATWMGFDLGRIKP
jgi:hypothetical protein